MSSTKRIQRSCLTHFSVHSCGSRTRAVAFGSGGRLPVGEGVPVQATFALEVNEWQGMTEPRLVVIGY